MKRIQAKSAAVGAAVVLVLGATAACQGELADSAADAHTDTDAGADSTNPDSAGTGASSGSDADGADDGATGGAASVTCSNQAPALTVERLTETAIAALGSPFDTDGKDLEGPGGWAPQYGKSPEIVPFSTGDELDVLFQDQTQGSSHAYVVHVIKDSASYAIDVAYRVESLGRIMGLTKDTSGNYYVATGVDEDDLVDPVYPPNDIHRPDIVRVVKFDENGCVLMESDVDMERGAQDAGSEIIVNPMVAATSRLIWGADRLLLVHGHNTEPDAALDGTRHQKAISTHINALDGTVTRASTMWVSHSFDQRVLFDGSAFVELHLGDAYPRFVALGRYNDAGGEGAYPTYQIKGALGANNTYTRLGGIAPSSDASYGHLVLFATERNTSTAAGTVLGTRDLALVRVARDFQESDTDESIIDEGAGTTTQTVESSGETVTNHVRWLTDLGTNLHAERPRLVALGNDEYVVLFERWSTASGNTYEGTFALRIDQTGAILAGPTELAGDHHLSRGDDAVLFDGHALFVTGDGAALQLNLVDEALGVTRVELP